MNEDEFYKRLAQAMSERDQVMRDYLEACQVRDEAQRALSGEAAHIRSLEGLLVDAVRERDEARSLVERLRAEWQEGGRMSSTEDRLVAYENAQLGAIARFPKMWGPPYAIEIGYLQLLETLLVTVRPDLDRSHPRFVKEKYREFLGRKYPEAGSSYLSGVFGDDELGPLMTALAEFEGEMRAVLKPQNVFSQYDLALVDAVRERDEARADFANACDVGRRQEARAEKAERERDEARAEWQRDLDGCNTTIDRLKAEVDRLRVASVSRKTSCSAAEFSERQRIVAWIRARHALGSMDCSLSLMALDALRVVADEIERREHSK